VRGAAARGSAKVRRLRLGVDQLPRMA
jgi:hypothetical protein